MAEKARYWDVHQCAWVTYAGPPVSEPVLGEAQTPPEDAAVPEQQPGISAPQTAGTPD